MGNDNNTKTNQVLLLGLEYSGKTSFLQRLTILHSGEIESVNYDPTIGMNFASFSVKNTKVDFWDIGGDPLSRSYWPTFYKNLKIGLVLYFVNISDESTFEASRKELLKLINEEKLKNTRFYLVFNCFLAKNVTLDDSTLEIEKEKVNTFINKIRAYPINLFDDRVDWEILSVIRSKISDTMLSKIFKFAT